MTKQDWLTVGLKLIGVYFAVLGFTVFCITVISLIIQAFFMDTPPYVVPRSGEYATLIGALQPVAYIIAAYYLIKKTDWCLEKIGVQTERGSEPPVSG